MNIKEIDHIITVSDFLNISKAADFLGISQPSLSRDISNLEHKLGYKLFFRLSRGLRLTAEGQLYLETFKQIKLELSRVEQKIKQLASDLSGHYIISLHSLLANNVLANFESNIEPYKDLSVDYIFETSRSATESVVSCRSDLAIVADAQNYPDLVKVKLWSEYVGLYSIDGLTQKTLLYNPSMIHAEKILNKYRTNKIKNINDYNVIHSILLKNNYMGLLPNPIVDTHQKLKLIKKFSPSVDISLIYRADRPKNKSLKMIIQCFKSAL